MQPFKRHDRRFRLWLWLLAVAGLLYGFGASAYPTGIYGYTTFGGGSDCTACHAPSNTYQYASPVVNIASSSSTTGTLLVGHQASLHVSASPNGSHNAAGGGFDLYVTQGSIAVPTGNRIKICPADADGGGGTSCTNGSSNQEITHSTEYAVNGSGALIFDAFNYTPASTGTATMWVCVNPTDGSYVNGGTPHADNQGPPVCTSQAITVAAAPTVNVSLASTSIALGQSTMLSWSSSNASACTASGAWSGSKASSGSQSVSPGATGSYTYVLTCTGLDGVTTASNSATLTVGSPVVTSVAVTPSNPSVAKGLTQQFTATATYSDGSTQDVSGNAGVSWLSSNTGVATIGSTGLAFAQGTGTSIISATFSGKSGSTTLTVTAPVVTGVAVTPANPSIAKGLTEQFTATATYSDGSTQNVSSSAAWSSSNTGVATISSTGLASTAATGSSTIGASYSGFSGSTTLTVTAPTVTAVAVTPANPSIAKGLSQQFVATATYTDNSTQDVSASASWSSSNTAVATITSTGLATAAGTGSSTIGASYSGHSGSTTLTVTAAVVSTVTVTPPSPSVAKGLTQQFTATATYTDNTTQDVSGSATWNSSNTGIATISSTGLATGVTQGGPVTITASYSGVSGTASLTVTAAVVTSVVVTPTNPSIASGLTQQFTATAVFSDSSMLDVTSNAGTGWLSSNTAVATVSATGLATGTGKGSATISASYSGVSGSSTLTVTVAAVTGLTVTPSSASIAKGRTQQFTATASLTDGTTQDVTSAATWTSSNTAVATIGAATGLASGIGQGGPVTITASYAGFSGSAGLTVTAPVVTALNVGPASASIAKGLSQQFTATATYSDSTTQDVSASAAWSSSNTAVATVSSTGLASGLAQGGPVTISAAYAGFSSSASLTVTAAVVTGVTVTPSAASIAKGLSQQFTAIAAYTDGTTQNVSANAATTWTSSNTAVATVSSSGLAAGIAQGGPVTITAAYSGFSGSASLTVTAAAVTAVSVSPSTAFIAKGQTQQFSATASFTDNSTLDVSSSATWTSSDTTVATISSTGLASGVGAGGNPVTITAAYSGKSGTAALTVTPPVPVSLSVTPASASVAKGLTQQFTATATLSDGTTQNVTANPATAWSSSSTAVATVSSTGLATGAGTGTAGITALYAGLSSTATLTVTAAVVTGLSVTPPSASIANGQTQQFTATATFSDASTLDVTSGAAWSSSNGTVATIGASTGLASGMAQGSVTIAATYSGQSASASLGVSVLAAPTNLAATSGNMKASLSWSAVSGAASYNIYQATSSGAETLVQSGVSGTSATLTGLSNGTTYYFQVSAVNAYGGEGARSTEASTTLRKSPTINVPPQLSLAATGYLTPFTPAATAVDADGNPAAVTASLSGPLRPGIYTVTYTARDLLGTTGSATQTLTLAPLAHLGPDQLVGDNQTVQVDFLLNGLAATPVTLAYTVSGTAAALVPNGGGTVTLTSTKSSLSFNIPAGVANAPDDTLILTLTSAGNAVLDGDVSSTIRIVHRNLAPVATIALNQSGQPRSVVFQDQGPATLSVTAVDPNAGDTPLYDWSATDNALVPPAGNVSSFSFDPAGLKAGTYTVRLTARSQAGSSSQATLALVVQATEPVLSSSADTNGDGIVDSIEGYLDSFGKAIPAYLDSDPAAPQALQSVPPGGSGKFTPYLETQQGDTLRLGPTVLAAGRVSGATLTAADVAAYGDGGGAVSNGTDTYTNIGGLFDFEVHGVAPGGTAQIVLPLQSAIRSNAVYRQYSSSAGWHDFVSDANDGLASAHSSGGVCPGPGSTAYSPGLTAFNDCVRLTIQDGGPDDEDGVANGVVRDPGGVALAPALAASSGTPKPNAGAFAPWVLLGLAAAAACRRRRPNNQGIR